MSNQIAKVFAPHQQRVVDEKAENEERTAKLHAFILDNPIFPTLPAEEQDRLQIQANLMGKLSDVLGQRIAAFGEAVQDSFKVEARVYSDGTQATGVAPLPGQSPLEQEITEKASTGPRVTPADIEAEIVGEHYFTARDGILGATLSYRPGGRSVPELDLLTFCVLVLSNGTRVVGINYGAIDPQQHDPERGCHEARAQAVEKVWELMGFRLRDKLAAE